MAGGCKDVSDSLIQGAPIPCSRFKRVEQTPGLQQFQFTAVWQLTANLLLLMVQVKRLQGALAAWGPRQ